MFTILATGLAKLRRWQERQRVMNELYTMDDRSLADIGVERSDIPNILAPRRAYKTGIPIGTRHAA